MPGYDTHYLYGVHSYRKMPQSEIKKAINDNREVYALGLFGPDIFFYSTFEVLIARKNIGSIMHTDKTGLFIKNMIDYVQESEGEHRNVCLSYLTGFLSHYVLDCICHPYVYWRTDYLSKPSGYAEKHFSLETDMDILLLRGYKDTTPYEFTKNSDIRITRKQFPIICEMLKCVMRRTYTECRITRLGVKAAIDGIRRKQKFIRIASDRAKYAIGNIEESVLGQRFISPLIPGGNVIKNEDPLNLKHDVWYNPWDLTKSYTTSVPDMLNKATEEHLLLAFLLNEYMEDKSDQSLAILMNNIGSKSYHSGLNSRIPS